MAQYGIHIKTRDGKRTTIEALTPHSCCDRAREFCRANKMRLQPSARIWKVCVTPNVVVGTVADFKANNEIEPKNDLEVIGGRPWVSTRRYGVRCMVTNEYLTRTGWSRHAKDLKLFPAWELRVLQEIEGRCVSRLMAVECKTKTAAL